jgi:hypothetical protein
LDDFIPVDSPEILDKRDPLSLRGPDFFSARATQVLDTARPDRHVPTFVKKEFREFLSCGVLALGFVRVRCASCGMDRLVAFSCKNRGFCNSCGSRRMADTAAHLVDRVFLRVPDVCFLPCRRRKSSPDSEPDPRQRKEDLGAGYRDRRQSWWRPRLQPVTEGVAEDLSNPGS